MSYRSELDALRERRENLARELESLRVQAAELESLKAREREIAGEITALDGRIDAGTKAKRRALPMLERLAVATPCNASWAAMTGDDRVRFCGECKKNVYNLSAMTAPEAESLLRAKEGDLCVRYYERADGTVMTQDCPVGVASKRKRQRAFGIAAAGAMALGAAAAAVAVTSKQGGARPTRVDPTERMETSAQDRAVPDVPPTPMPIPTVRMGGPTIMPPPQMKMGKMKPVPNGKDVF
jgi:hypothetical protein